MTDSPVPTDNEFYSLLGLPRDCSQDEVKKAYRQLAAIFHPDKTTDPSLAEVRVASLFHLAVPPWTRTDQLQPL